MEKDRPSKLLRTVSTVPFTIEEFYGVSPLSEVQAFTCFAALLLFNVATVLAIVKIATDIDVLAYAPAALVGCVVCWLFLRAWLKRAYKEYRPRVDFATEPVEDQFRRRRAVCVYMVGTCLLFVISVLFASY